MREAHPSDSNWADRQLEIEDPSSLQQRNKVAASCNAKLDLALPCVVDDMKDTVNQLYKAWPERIYVLDKDKVIRHKSGIGPFGFDVKAAEKSLLKLLDAGTETKSPRKIKE